MKLLLILFIFFHSTASLSYQFNKKVFLDFNSGGNKVWSGWDYIEKGDIDSEFDGSEGWILNAHDIFGPSDSFLWGTGPRSVNKTDYGKNNSAIIDNTNFAPGSDTAGGSFKVFETDESINDSDNFSTWWIWYDGKPLTDRGVTDSSTNRMSFYLKTKGVSPMSVDGGESGLNINFHIGTYLCWDATGVVDNPGSGTGTGCPYEGPGNQHYYHYLAINSDAWIHVLLDQHPQHLRGISETISNNQSMITDGKSYFEHINQMYMEIRFDQTEKTAYWLDEISFYTETEDQNENSITSLWVGYWDREDYFELGFNDMSYSTYNDDSQSTYEIRWSISRITNENYESAQLVEPQFYSGLEYTNNNTNFRRPNRWNSIAWTRFKIAGIKNISEIYFAVKDISSVTIDHSGSKWPWTAKDGHNSLSNKIKTINYLFKPKPKQPTNLIIK